jgi:hypothetical protein
MLTEPTRYPAPGSLLAPQGPEALLDVRFPLYTIGRGISSGNLKPGGNTLTRDRGPSRQLNMDTMPLLD